MLSPYNGSYKSFLVMRNKMAYSILSNCHIAKMCRDKTSYDLGDADTIVLNDDAIAWVGTAEDLPAEYVLSLIHI